MSHRFLNSCPYAIIAMVIALPTLTSLRAAAAGTNNEEAVTITADQAKSVKVEVASPHAFATQRSTVGNIDYFQDRNVQVFAPYPGRVRQVFAKLGDDVVKGAPLFSIDSPDLILAESTVISTAGVLQLTSRSLERAKKLATVESAAQKDLDQATSDQQAAAAALKAARDTLRIFGKSDAEIDELIASRKVDGEFVIKAPIDGRITSRVAAPGLFLQPANSPAPFTLADISTLWMLGYVLETEAPEVRIGNPVTVVVPAFPSRKFEGRITAINTSVDPNTHRVAVRAEVADPLHELLPQMIAKMQIQTGEPKMSVGIPNGGVVREGDGTMTVWVTKDGSRFTRRDVKLGVEQGGIVQILEGLSAGESVAGDGALFLSTQAVFDFGGK